MLSYSLAPILDIIVIYTHVYSFYSCISTSYLAHYTINHFIIFLRFFFQMVSPAVGQFLPAWQLDPQMRGQMSRGGEVPTC